MALTYSMDAESEQWAGLLVRGLCESNRRRGSQLSAIEAFGSCSRGGFVAGALRGLSSACAQPLALATILI